MNQRLQGARMEADGMGSCRVGLVAGILVTGYRCMLDSLCLVFN